jgi:hypothetical protein
MGAQYIHQDWKALEPSVALEQLNWADESRQSTKTMTQMSEHRLL